jgi:hypothetical protein
MAPYENVPGKDATQIRIHHPFKMVYKFKKIAHGVCRIEIQIKLFVLFEVKYV